MLLLLPNLWLAGYLGAYAMLRASHTIIHFSNAHHWDPEKRGPGHYVGPLQERGDVSRAVLLIYGPLMSAEGRLHEWLDARGRQ